MVQIFLEGVACLGKTSYLRRLRAISEWPVYEGDYKEYLDTTGMDPGELSRSLNVVSFIDKGEGIYDRSPFATAYYNIVYDQNDLGEDERIAKLGEEMVKFQNGRRWIIMMIPDGSVDYADIVNKMLKRNNGLDWISQEYVRRQVNVANKLVKMCPELLCIRVGTRYGEWHSQMDNLIRSLYCGQVIVDGPRRVQRPYDGGMDLTCVGGKLIKGEMAHLELEQRVFIPPGIVGIMYPRSSFVDGIVASGVVDATYSGTLFMKVLACKTRDVGKGEAIAQLVFTRHEKPVVVTGELPMCGRSSNALGSTGLY